VLGHELRDLFDIGELIWLKGWAEANAGNVSIRLPNSASEVLVPFWQEITHSNNLNSNSTADDYDWTIISAAGSRFRDFRSSGAHNFVLAGVEKSSILVDNYICQLVYPASVRPTSESKTHLAVQNWLKQKNSGHMVILHAHLTEWLILSNLAQYQKNRDKLASDIAACLPEINIYFPNGLVLLPFTAPGSAELAELTLNALENSNVIVWEKHGVVVTAETINLAFDYIEISAKAAAVYLALNS
jgi:rhamnulose-1-phosphate aldolase